MATRTLVIVRHAKAEAHDWARDARRALAERGLTQAANVGLELRAEGFQPGLALVSPALRARQTWEALAEAAGFTCPVRSPEGLYSGYVTELVAAVQDVPDDVWDLIVVGHEPTVSAATVALAGPASQPKALAAAQRGFSTAGRARLTFEGPSWRDAAPGRFALAEVVRSRL